MDAEVKQNSMLHGSTFLFDRKAKTGVTCDTCKCKRRLSDVAIPQVMQINAQISRQIALRGINLRPTMILLWLDPLRGAFAALSARHSGPMPSWGPPTHSPAGSCP